MDKNELIEKIKSVKDPVKQIRTVYKVLDELGIKYKVTNCPKCKKDLYHIALQELGVIEDAAELSDFNEQKESVENVGEWVYVVDRPMVWNGHLIDNNTQEDIKKAFIEHFPNGYFKKIEKQDNNNTNNEE